MEQISQKILAEHQKKQEIMAPSTMGGETGNKAVTVMWRKHFSALLNSKKL